MSRTADQTNRVVTNVLAIAADRADGEIAMHNSVGGYPSTTPGAGAATPTPTEGYDGPCQEPDCGHSRPCPDHDSSIHLTQPERDATTIDRARLDLIAHARDMRLLDTISARAAGRLQRWAHPTLTETAVRKKLTNDGDMWCHNCRRHGFNNPHEENRLECRDCADFRRQWGSPRTRAIIDKHERFGKTSASQAAFVTRELDTHAPDWRKRLPQPKAPKRKVKGARAA